jgi:hypothetical protein
MRKFLIDWELLKRCLLVMGEKMYLDWGGGREKKLSRRWPACPNWYKAYASTGAS